MANRTAATADRSRQPSLFTEGLRLSPGQENVLVALDYLGAVPGEPQQGSDATAVAGQAELTPHVTRARLGELRKAGLIASGECPLRDGRPLADNETRHAHYLTQDGYLRSRWAVAARRQSANGTIEGQDRRLLERLYQTAGVPTDRLVAHPNALHWIGSTFREKTAREASDAELVKYMIRCRKQGGWPRLGHFARDAFGPAAEPLPKRERKILVHVYQDLGRSCDETLTSAWHGRSLARAFEAAAGVRRPVRLLIDTLLSARKAGALPHLRPDGPE